MVDFQREENSRANLTEFARIASPTVLETSHTAGVLQTLLRPRHCLRRRSRSL